MRRKGLYHFTEQEIKSVNLLLQQEAKTVKQAVALMCDSRPWFREKLFKRTGRAWKLQRYQLEALY